LEPPPADLTDRALRSSSPRDFYRKINVGVAGTAMPGFAEQLTDEERWALALYASNFRFSDAERRAGAEILRTACPACLVRLASFAETASLTDDSLAVILGRELGRVPADSIVRLAVAHARTAGALEELGGDVFLAATGVVERARAAAQLAAELAERGDRDVATRQALDAYLVFEEIESAVRARSPGVARRVERAFADLRAAAAAGDGAGTRAAVQRVEETLARALAELRTASSPALLFTQSLVIMLREGFEAILIIGALVAFLTRAGAPERKREIGWGVGAALVASLGTAAVYGVFFRSATASQELVEGLTMLAAAVVLFWVSYWLVSKIELRKWQAFVSSRMTQALSSRRALALAAVAFLAVYREGFETVLFYAGLLASAGRVPGAGAAVSAGILVGLGALGVVYFLMQRYGSRIPMKPFFAVTSALLYVMAFSFVGQGIAELQEAGYIPTTPIPWLPTLPALGIFPTIETALLQAALVLALAGALLWVFGIEPRQRGPDPSR
jgi:high-affinity iron transporter